MIDIRKIISGAKRVGTASIDPICKLIAATGLFMIVLEICYAFVSGINPDVGFLVIILSVGYFGGFFLQGFILALMRRKKKQDYSWEGIEKYFSLPAAVPALIIAFIIAVGSNRIFYLYYSLLLNKGVISQLDAYSLQPKMGVVAFLFAAVVGIVTQFYPYNRIISMERVLTHSAISLLCFTLTGGSLFIGIFFLIYVVCAVLILNQSYIIRVYNSVTVTKITASARLYNARMILLCLFLTSIGGFFAMIMVNGIYILLRFIVFLAIFTIIGRNQPGSQRVEDVNRQVVESVFGNQFNSNLFMLIGALIMLAMAIVLVVFARSSVIKSFLEAVKRWFDEFIALFMGSNEHESEREINYCDTVEKIEIIEKSRAARIIEKKRLTVRDFNSELAALKTDEEKLGYSYTVMIYLLSLLNPNLHKSDTPRELESKISASMSIGSIGDITELIEKIKYAEKAADSATSKRILGEVCAVVEQRLD